MGLKNVDTVEAVARDRELDMFMMCVVVAIFFLDPVLMFVV